MAAARERLRKHSTTAALVLRHVCLLILCRTTISYYQTCETTSWLKYNDVHAINSAISSIICDLATSEIRIQERTLLFSHTSDSNCYGIWVILDETRRSLEYGHET